MSHKRDCLTEEAAKDRGREDRRTGWDSPYAMGDCYEAQQAYDDGVREERRAEQRRREEREQQRLENEQFEQMMAEAQERGEFVDAMNETNPGADNGETK